MPRLRVHAKHGREMHHLQLSHSCHLELLLLTPFPTRRHNIIINLYLDTTHRSSRRWKHPNMPLAVLSLGIFDYPSPTWPSRRRSETPASLAHSDVGTDKLQAVRSSLVSSHRPCLAEMWEKRAWPLQAAGTGKRTATDDARMGIGIYVSTSDRAALIALSLPHSWRRGGRREKILAAGG